MAKFSAQFLNSLANPTYAKGLFEAGKGLGQTPGILMEQKRQDEEQEKIAGMTRLETAEYLVKKAKTVQDRLIAQNNLEAVKRQEKADAEEKARKEGAASIEIMSNQVTPLIDIVNSGGSLSGDQRGMLTQLGEGIRKVSRITGAASTLSPLQQSTVIGQSQRQQQASDQAQTQIAATQRDNQLLTEATTIARKPGQLSNEDVNRLRQIEQQRFRIANGLGTSTSNIIGSTDELLTQRQRKIDDDIERVAEATALRETGIVDSASNFALAAINDPRSGVSSVEQAIELATQNLSGTDKLNLEMKIRKKVDDGLKLLESTATASREGYLSAQDLEFIKNSTPERNYILENNPEIATAIDNYNKQLAFENGEEGARSPYSSAPAVMRKRDAVLISRAIAEDAKRVQKLNSSDEALKIKFSTAVNQIINTPEKYNLSFFREDDVYEIVEDLKNDDNQAQYNDLQDRVVLALKNNPSQKIIPAIKTALSEMGINAPGQQQSEAEIRRQQELKEKLDSAKADFMKDGLTEQQAEAQIREIQTQERIGQMLVTLGDPTRQRFSEFTSGDVVPSGETREEMEARAATGVNNPLLNFIDMRSRYQKEQEFMGTMEDEDKIFNANWQGM